MKKKLITWGQKIFTNLTKEIKNVSDNLQKFKTALKHFLYTYSFYTLDEILVHKYRSGIAVLYHRHFVISYTLFLSLISVHYKVTIKRLLWSDLIPCITTDVLIMCLYL
jgi:hypothetical protein